MGSYTHAIGGLLIMAVFYVPLRYLRVTNSHWIAMAIAVSFYWGREKRDHENRLKRPQAEVWYRGILPWEYSPKGISDFAWPLGACLFAALTAEYCVRKRKADSSIR